MIYSHPDLLQDLRQEIGAVTKQTTVNGTAVRSLDITSLKEGCPLLLSTFREVLRYRSMGTSVREVMKDTELGGYILKKGAILQMPSRVVHQDASIWGADVAEFRPRFIKGEKHQTLDGKAPKNVCFRGSGGGKSKSLGPNTAGLVARAKTMVLTLPSTLSRTPLRNQRGSRHRRHECGEIRLDS